jgi:hypothetical protein
MFFSFPPDARWNPERSAVEFSIGVGEYDGTVSVYRRVFPIPARRKPHAATLHRSLSFTPDPARTHRRAKGSSPAIDGRRQRRDQRAGFSRTGSASSEAHGRLSAECVIAGRLYRLCAAATTAVPGVQAGLPTRRRSARATMS